MMRCIVCDKPFIRNNHRQTMCSDNCRKKHYNDYVKEWNKSDKAKSWKKEYKDSGRKSKYLKDYLTKGHGRFWLYLRHLNIKHNLTFNEDKVINDFNIGCIICGFKEDFPLDYHHINGNKKNNNLDNLEYICPNCHARKTRRKLEVPKIIEETNNSVENN